MSGRDHRSITFGEHVVDLDSGMLYRGEREVPLRPKSFAVLTYLAERPGRLVSKDELLDAVWGDVIVTDGALTQCIIDVRRALGDPGIIRNVPRRGYLLELPERSEADSGAAGDRFWLAGHRLGILAAAIGLVALLPGFRQNLRRGKHVHQGGDAKAQRILPRPAKGMHMGVDQAGQERASVARNLSQRRRNVQSGTDRGNLAVLDDHVLVFMKTLPVKHPNMGDGETASFGLKVWLWRWQRQDQSSDDCHSSGWSDEPGH